MNVAESSLDYGKQVYLALKNAGLRVENDDRNEKISYKIRESAKAKIPYMLILGDKEKEDGTITVRMRGNQQKTLKLDEFIDMVKQQIASHN